MKKRFIDYKLKSEVMKAGLHKQVGFLDSSEYLLHVEGIVPEVDLDDLYFRLCNEYDYKWIKEARKINTASYRRVERLKGRIAKYLLSGQCIWLTLKFKPEVLANTSRETRRKYVQRYLKSKADCYVANIDFGAKNGLEHYHAVVLTDWIENTWEYGYCWHEKVRKTTDYEKLSKYINKLTNHAIKETTKRCCYIYSRNVNN